MNSALHLNTLDAAMISGSFIGVEEITWLAEMASKSESIVEIGSWLGCSTRALADNTDGFVLAVDDWRGPRDVETIPAFPVDKNNNTNFSRFLENLETSRAYQSKKLLTWRKDHRDITPELIGKVWPLLHPDFVFIDGDHSYESVKQDITNWLPFLERGGIISGHDYYCHPGEYYFPGVKQAVDELFPDVRLAIPRCLRVWMWQKP